MFAIIEHLKQLHGGPAEELEKNLLKVKLSNLHVYLQLFNNKTRQIVCHANTREELVRDAFLALSDADSRARHCEPLSRRVPRVVRCRQQGAERSQTRRNTRGRAPEGVVVTA